MKGLYQASSANNNIIKLCGSVAVGQIKDMQCTHEWSLASFFLWPILILPLMETGFTHHIYLIKRCLINFYNLQRSIYLWYHLFSVKFLKYLTTVMVNNLLILCIQTEIHLHVSRVLMSCYKICRLWSGTVPFLSYSIWIKATIFNLRPLFRVQRKSVLRLAIQASCH